MLHLCEDGEHYFSLPHSMRHWLLSCCLVGSLAAPALAQQPIALPAAPTAPAPSPLPADAASAAPAAPAAEGPQPGHRYEVKLRSGVGFTGILKEVAPGGELVFEAQGLGTLRVAAANITQLQDLDAPVPGAQVGLRAGYYDIGSGSRYLFGPSARNLRQGEGVVQDVWLFLAGVNYGITNNFSVGAYLSLVPGVGLQNQFVMLTPKVGFEVGHNWHVGAGALLLRIPDGNTGYGAGLVYGVATRGSADNNFSLGVGYGFAGGGIGSTPALYLAGQTRVSRRVSLMTENYIVAAASPVFFGLYGIKLNWPRLSLGIASGYAGYIDNENYNNSYGYTYNSPDRSFFAFGYVYPVYLDLSFRFGKPYQPAAPRP